MLSYFNYSLCCLLKFWMLCCNLTGDTSCTSTSLSLTAATSGPRRYECYQLSNDNCSFSNGILTGLIVFHLTQTSISDMTTQHIITGWLILVDDVSSGCVPRVKIFRCGIARVFVSVNITLLTLIVSLWRWRWQFQLTGGAIWRTFAR